MTDLSILIPARGEMFLAQTVRDLVANTEADTEIIVVMDGYWADPPIPQHPQVTVLHFPESVGQRAATNAAARIAEGKYLMKVDSHCAFDRGFDRIMLENIQPNWTMVPVMRNLHAFDWVCPNDHRRYQGPSGPCTVCGEPTTMDIVWIAKPSPQSTAFCFDPEPRFQYFSEYKHRPEGKGDLTETMSLQGSCFMLSRDKYFELGVCDESFGSWGSQGIEVACKTWLSGGRVIVDHRTWYAHLFRTQGGDFSFQYPISHSDQEYAKNKARDLFFNNAWPKQIRPLSWLVKKFWPVPGWTDKDLAMISGEGEVSAVPSAAPSVGVLYYTDNRLNPVIFNAAQRQLKRSVNGHRLVSVSLQPTAFGENIVIPLERGYPAMFRQILAGLEALDSDVVFFTEHDVLYHPSHFKFVPSRGDVFYYNTNVYKVAYPDGRALHYDCQQLSGLAASRDLLLEHFRRRVANTEAALARYGDTREFRNWIRRQGFEPGTHGRAERVDDYKAESWRSEFPNIDIRHDQNLTPSRWSQDQFRNQRYCRGWIESDSIPGWGNAADLMRGLG